MIHGFVSSEASPFASVTEAEEDKSTMAASYRDRFIRQLARWAHITTSEGLARVVFVLDEAHVEVRTTSCPASLALQPL